MSVFFLLLLPMILLVLSASFSGSETAYFSISPWRLQRLRKEGSKTALRASELLKQSEYLLIIILLGNETVNAGLSQFSAIMNRKFNVGNSSLITILFGFLVTSSLIILGEITPKALAIRRPYKFISTTRYIIHTWKRIIRPLARPLEKVTLKILRKKTETITTDEQNTSETRNDILKLVALGTEEGILSKQEEHILRHVFELSSLTTREVMTPRHRISAIEQSGSVADAIQIMSATGHSRIPVYKKDIDDIVGIVEMKDFLPFIKSEESQKKPVESFLRSAFCVPEQISLRLLLAQMQGRRQTVALVFDEYGGIKGLVTLEDIIEEIVGDIKDTEDKEESYIEKLKNGAYLVDGQALLRDLNREIGFPLISRFSALQGYIMHLFGRLPKTREKISDANYSYEVISIKGQHLERIKLSELKIRDKKKPKQGAGRR